jgi:hypothetical protein
MIRRSIALVVQECLPMPGATTERPVPESFAGWERAVVSNPVGRGRISKSAPIISEIEAI